jgi:hypothetical protein
MFNNKRGATLLDNYIFMIVSFFGIAILGYILIEYAVIGSVLPTLQVTMAGSTIDAATQLEIQSGWGTIKTFLRIMPFAVWLIIIIWIFIVQATKEDESVYG